MNAFRFMGVSFLIFTTQLIAQTQPVNEQLDEVVVTDTRFEINRQHSGKVITKITQQQLKHLKGKTLAEIINTIAGIEINGSRSNAGQNLNYYVRGGRNRQVLIVIDGIAISDASQIANDYDLRLLDEDQVESIEVLKGAASTLYGSGAATAVINITLKKDAEQPIELSLNGSLGSNQSQDSNEYRIEDFNNSVALNGKFDKFNYMARFGNQYTNGLSAVYNGTEADVFNSINGYLNLGYKISKAFTLNTYASFDNIKTDFDDSFTLSDADNKLTTKQYRTGLTSKFEYKKGKVELNTAYNNIRRKVKSNFPNEYHSESVIADLFNRHAFTQQFGLVTGVHLNLSKMESFEAPFGSTTLEPSITSNMANSTILDPYINALYISDFGFQLNAGLRINTHNHYDAKVVYSINPSFTHTTSFGYIKGLASYSTAYITPSLYQLYEPNFGNTKLKPEENRTVEVGTELKISNTLLFSVVYFNRKEKQFVDFKDLGNFKFQYSNTSKNFTASGVELSGQLNITKAITLHANGTYTKVEEDLQLRIPEVKINTSIDYSFSNNLHLNLSYQFNDARKDIYTNPDTFASINTTLGSYHLLDFYTSFNIIPGSLRVYGSLSNILNEDYQELFGFSTKGRNLRLGLQLDLL